jgi:hypothetical protein
MTNYLITGKLGINKRTGQIRGAMPIKIVKGLIRSKKTSLKSKEFWKSQLSKPIKHLEAKPKFQYKGKTVFWLYNSRGLLIK